MAADEIRCPRCGTSNAIAAIACVACGSSLVGTESAWVEAREQEDRREERRQTSSARANTARTLVAVAVVGLLLGFLAWVAFAWYRENYYFGARPSSDGHPIEYWVEMLDSEDHFLRRRAALVLEKLAPQLNARDARAVDPALERAVEDEDAIVRARAERARAGLVTHAGSAAGPSEGGRPPR
jgi:hypothetical protein